MERYKTVDEFLSDLNINMDGLEQLIPKLEKIVYRALNYGVNRYNGEDELGFMYERATLRGLYKSEKELLKPWRDSGVQWKDADNNVYSIIYEPAKYVGKSDIIRVSKEYFFNK